MTTKVPTIPTITDGDVTQILSSVKMLLDVREGRVGDKLDANVTYRDLVGLNLVKDPTGSVIYTGATGAAASLPVRPFGTDSDGYDPTADLTPPPAPESVSALGSIGAIFLSWSTPAYKNHAFAEIWRSGIDDVATAVLIGTSPTQGFVDIPGDNLPRYYWVRFASRADVRGPYSQTSVSATASPDPAVLIAAISGQISESSLAQSLSQRIAKIEADSDTVNSVQNTVRTLDKSVSQQITTVSAGISGFQAALTAESTARATADNALTQSITTLTSSVGANTTAISQEAIARANADNSLFAQYTVKIDTNGHVSGFGLASELVNGTPTSAFIIRADKFAVVDPSSTANNLTNNPSSNAVPFAVSGGVVYLKSAMIEDGSITNAKIQTLTANKITAGNINATIGINGGKVYGAELYAGGTVTVNGDGSFTANNPTVKINGGNATFVATSFRVANSASGSPTDYIPFEVINGVVFIKSAMIQNASISLAKIDTGTITNLSSINANMGTITAGKMQSSDGKFVIDLDNKTISIEV